MYLQAGEGGLPEALYFVASAYNAGSGVAPDRKQALIWYRKAAAAGDRDAEFALAVAVLEGHGVRKDEAAGVRLLTRLTRQEPEAIDYLAYHYLKRGRLLLAKKWATRAAKRGVDSARHRLAEVENAHSLDLTRRARRRRRD